MNINKLNRKFQGKVCSIFTQPLNRAFNVKQSIEYFTCRIEEIDADGIYGKHPFQNTISFYPWGNINSISTEVELDPNKPEDKELIDKLIPPKKEESSSEFIDIEQLNQLAQNH